MAFFYISMGFWMVKKYLTSFLFLLVILNISHADQEKNPESNLKFLEILLNTTLADLKNNEVLNENDSVFFKVVSADSSFSSIQESFIDNTALNKFNLNVYSSSEKFSMGKLVIIRWIEWSINYKKINRRFWQRQKFQRNLKADFFVEVLNRKDNKLLFCKNVKRDTKSIINRKEILKIQNPEYAFTRGQFVETKGVLKKWLEPIFLFAISGAVIYLFYSLRTQ